VNLLRRTRNRKDWRLIFKKDKWKRKIKKDETQSYFYPISIVLEAKFPACYFNFISAAGDLKMKNIVSIWQAIKVKQTRVKEKKVNLINSEFVLLDWEREKFFFLKK